ncbi:MAG: hypothetical protein KZQ90_08325 [Candidatus Thiodiazotropha sp. (ex Codakia rugifera)]|nr:hypothetical protein [Candidatus Thiodiazotropha sp. (ex Codakia rugifera)]
MTPFLPKDFIETAEGLIFAVVAAGEETQRVLSFLRYQRSSTGYKKLSTHEANELLKNHYPAYLYYSRSRDVNLHGVPRECIVHHHQPRQRLQTLCHRAYCDGLEHKLRLLVGQFEAHGLDRQTIGITGSLLIGAHTTHSDIDLVFYRRETFFKARAIVKRLLDRKFLHNLDDALWQDAYVRRGCSLTFEEFVWHERRKFNKAAIQQTKFDISLLIPEQELDGLSYRKQGQYNLQSSVTEDRYSFDYPARYQLDHPSIEEVVSYTATFAGQAQKGETVEVQGQLEISTDGHRRIVVGSDREALGEYIKVLCPQDMSAV